jgi:Trypsin
MPSDRDAGLTRLRDDVAEVMKRPSPDPATLRGWIQTIEKAHAWPPQVMEDVELAILQSDVESVAGLQEASTGILLKLMDSFSSRSPGTTIRRQVDVRLELDKMKSQAAAADWRKYVAAWGPLPEASNHDDWIQSYLASRRVAHPTKERLDAWQNPIILIQFVWRLQMSSFAYVIIILLVLTSCIRVNGGSDPKIIGGETAQARRFMASILDEGSTDPFCGGALIAKNIVLTAAHCVSDTKKRLVVGLGQSDASVYSSPGFVPIKVKAIKVHERYFDSIIHEDYDIALLLLEDYDAKSLGINVQPIQIADNIAYFGEAGHLFRRKPVTCFGASRSAMLTPSERSDV